MVEVFAILDTGVATTVVALAVSPQNSMAANARADNPGYRIHLSHTLSQLSQALNVHPLESPTLQHEAY